MIVKDVDLNSEAWCELVFEGKNREFGAYYLRKTSSKRHLFALLVVIAGIIIFLFLSKLILINISQTQQAREYELKSIELSDLIALEDGKKSNPLKTEEKPLLEELTRLMPPIVAEDDSIEELKEELRETNLAEDSIKTFSEEDEHAILSNRELTQVNPKAMSDSTVADDKNRNAEFPDGQIAMLRYIYQNIHYPSAALKQRINGRVVYSFIINEDGSISDITLVQGVYSFLDDEVLRVIRSMPAWNPAMKEGKPIKIKYIMPVMFKL